MILDHSCQYFSPCILQVVCAEIEVDDFWVDGEDVCNLLGSSCTKRVFLEDQSPVDAILFTIVPETLRRSLTITVTELKH